MRYVVIVTGFQVVGPFNDYDLAVSYKEHMESGGYTCTIHELHPTKIHSMSK